MLGLGLTSTTHKSRCVFDENGWINDTGSYWTHDIGAGSTSLDDMDTFTIIAHVSLSALPAPTSTNFNHICNFVFDTTHDTGFAISGVFAKYRNASGANATNQISFHLADGAGIYATLGGAVNKSLSRWGIKKSESDGFGAEFATGSPHFGIACRFRASTSPNEMELCTFSNTLIIYDEASNDIANSGTISDQTNVQIGHSGWTGFSQPCAVIHKVSIWNSYLTDTEIMKLNGFNHTTLADVGRSSLDGFYRHVTRFTSYSDLSIDTPEHEWDFTTAEPKIWSSGTISDTGNQSDLDMTPGGSPPIGSRGQQL